MTTLLGINVDGLGEDYKLCRAGVMTCGRLLPKTNLDGKSLLANQLPYQPDGTLYLEGANNNLLTAVQSKMDSGWSASFGTAQRDTAHIMFPSIMTGSLHLISAGVGAEMWSNPYVTATPSQAYTSIFWIKGSGGLKVGIDERNDAGALVSRTLSSAVSLDANKFNPFYIKKTFSGTGTRLYPIIVDNSQAIDCYVGGASVVQSSRIPSSYQIGASTVNGDYLSLPMSIMNLDAWTVEFWVYVTGYEVGYDSQLLNHWSFTNNADTITLWYTPYGWQLILRDHALSISGSGYVSGVSAGWHKFTIRGQPGTAADLIIDDDIAHKGTIASPTYPSAKGADMAIGGSRENLGHYNTFYRDFVVSNTKRTDQDLINRYALGGAVADQYCTGIAPLNRDLNIYNVVAR
jgi:hypothetical protein